VKFRNRELGLFWYWVNERHSIYLRRRAGDPFPWTKDKILREYKFTNVFRQLDRMTINLNRRIQTPPLCNDPPPDRLYRIMLFRAFNWHETYDLIHKKGADTNVHKMKKVLHAAARDGDKIFTGAYIVTNAGQSESKIDVMCDALGVMCRGRGRAWDRIAAKPTMQNATEVIAEFPMQGMFTAYEVACDLRYQPGMPLENAPDVMTWANPGPGAQRGVRRLLVGQAKREHLSITKKECIEVMQELLAMGPERFRHWADWPMEMREIEHSLCEVDKYLRAKNGEGRPRSKYRPPRSEK
jgi:hypothetical protein